MTKLTLIIALALSGFTSASAQPGMAQHTNSDEFEQLKSLIGMWQGEMPVHKGNENSEHAQTPQKMMIEYRLTAGGSVIQETINAGTPMEMVTMYHDRGGKLGLTHYCMLGNQPQMDFTGTIDGILHFAADSDDIAKSGMSMNSLALTIVDADKIIQRWSLVQDGDEQEAHDMHLTRVQ